MVHVAVFSSSRNSDATGKNEFLVKEVFLDLDESKFGSGLIIYLTADRIQALES
jgi:hypothetical protein